ncbi:RebB family R body protein [Curvibacter sp. CHRR-16]|uniref:RebB family R body protein n=1 Tax=Curvibacter sp. CHRR-16 TaxID=2835872 RepID=UPI001BDB0470|nr:RebB family R body protein [Curvibacter sp. CHRR-16]MBT0569618.1 RebB family R body protein [Curvibacter sp. CHRR-16]
MAFPTAVNSQVSDSITQVNTEVIGVSPAIATGNLMVATGQALSNTAHNATNNQNQAYVTMQTNTTQSLSTLFSVDTSSTGIAIKRIEAVR